MPQFQILVAVALKDDGGVAVVAEHVAAAAVVVLGGRLPIMGQHKGSLSFVPAQLYANG